MHARIHTKTESANYAYIATYLNTRTKVGITLSRVLCILYRMAGNFRGKSEKGLKIKQPVQGRGTAHSAMIRGPLRKGLGTRLCDDVIDTRARSRSLFNTKPYLQRPGQIA